MADIYTGNEDKRLKTMSDWDLIRRLMSYALPYWKKFVLVFLFMLIATLLFVYEPILIANSLALIIGDFDFALLTQYLALLLAVIIVGNIFNFVQTMMLQVLGQSIVYNIRKEIFTHLQFHDIAYLNSRPTGSLVTRVTNDTNTLNEMYTSVIITLFKNLLTIILILIVMFIIDVRLSLYVLSVIPFIVLFAFIFRRFSRKAYRQVRANTSSINAFLAEHLSGMKIIQIFNKEAVKFKQFNKRNQKLKKSYYKQITVFGIFRPTMYLLYMIAVVIVFLIGGNGVIDKVIDYSVLFAFYQYVGRFFDPIQQLAEQFNILQSAFASSERIFGILDNEPKVIDAEDSIELNDVKGEIEFRNVWFAYNDEEWILKNVSFKAKAKESVAFVGATGAGKTTILALITRNYDIQKGTIFLDGVDITTIKKSSLRSHIGQMLQDVFMFSVLFVQILLCVMRRFRKQKLKSHVNMLMQPTSSIHWNIHMMKR